MSRTGRRSWPRCAGGDKEGCELLAPLTLLGSPVLSTRTPAQQPASPLAPPQASDKLVVLEVQSQLVCQTGFDEEPELHWEADRRAAMEPCRGLKHAFARIARECQDVVFLSLEASRRAGASFECWGPRTGGHEGGATRSPRCRPALPAVGRCPPFENCPGGLCCACDTPTAAPSLQADSDEGSELCDRLGIEVLPTVQFWRGGQKLWEHRGVANLQQDLGEGAPRGWGWGWGGRRRPCIQRAGAAPAWCAQVLHSWVTACCLTSCCSACGHWCWLPQGCGAILITPK